MARHWRIAVVLLLIAGVVACPLRRSRRRPPPLPAPATRLAGPVASWTAQADEAMRLLWEFAPGQASALGLRDFDRLLARRSGKALKGQFDRLTEAVQRLYAIPEDELTAAERVDRQLLIAQLRLAIHEIAVEGRPLFAPTDDLDDLRLALLTPWFDVGRPLPARLDALAERLLQLPALLTASRENLHQPSALLCRAALADARGLRAFLVDELRPLGERADTELRQRLAVGIDEAVLGLGRYVAALAPRCGDGPELVPIGSVNYAKRMGYQHGLALDAAAVAAQAEDWLGRARQGLLALPASTPLTPLSAPPGFERRIFLDTLRGQTATLQTLVAENHLISLPPAPPPLRVAEPPVLLRDEVLGLALVPPPVFGSIDPTLLIGGLPGGALDGALADRLFTRLTDSAQLLQVAAETYPGRYLRRLLARRQVSPVRRTQDSSMLDDGWALYAMGLALEHHLVVDDTRARRVYWQALRLAAARALVDARLHGGELDFAGAVTLLAGELAEEGGDRQARAEREVLGMLRHPTRAAGMLLGKLAIDRMRERAAAFKGQSFDLRRFHDALLAQGSIPPSYLAHLLFGDALPRLDPYLPVEAPAAAAP